MQMYAGKPNSNGSSTVVVTSTRSVCATRCREIAERLVLQVLSHVNNIDTYQYG